MLEDDKQHIDAICRRHNLKRFTLEDAEKTLDAGELTYCDQSYSSQWVNSETGETKDRGFFVDECDNPEEEYFTSLHEIAHLMQKHNNENPQQAVENELEAWQWAFSHAQYFPKHESTILAMLDSLTTYTDNAERLNRPQSLLAMSYPAFWTNGMEEVEKFCIEALACGGRGQTEFTFRGVTVPTEFAIRLSSFIIKSIVEETNGKEREEQDGKASACGADYVGSSPFGQLPPQKFYENVKPIR